MLSLLLSLFVMSADPGPFASPVPMQLDIVALDPRLDLEQCSELAIELEAAIMIANYGAGVEAMNTPTTHMQHPDDPCPCNPGWLWPPTISCPPGKQAQPGCLAPYLAHINEVFLEVIWDCGQLYNGFASRIEANLELDSSAIANTCHGAGTAAAQAEIQAAVDAAIEAAWADLCAERAGLQADAQEELDNTVADAVARCCKESD